MSAFNVTRLSRHIGAEITGIDLRQLDADTVAPIKSALNQHLMLVFRDQSLTADELYRLASLFGEPAPYPFVDGIDGYPEIVQITKQPEETVNFGGVWHSDTTYLPTPAMGAMLYGLTIPETGGDTLFSSMYAAYDKLSDGLKGFLKPLTAVNDADKAAIAETRPGQPKKGLIAEHPVIRVHPETGRKLLYVNRAHTTRFSDMTEAESADLLEYLFELAAAEDITCRLQWQPGSLAFWDNRACQHFPLNDYQGQLRSMLRISLAGDQPVS
ncbi:MAG: TauD/TfdA family dioxygenase [Gammaproteobacteria bacterium]